MAKEKFRKQEVQEKPEAQEMTLAEARAYRASLYQASVVELSETEKKDQFRLFWAQEKYKYGKSKELEPILWLHLKATKHDAPEKFEDGLAHFGLKKIK